MRKKNLLASRLAFISGALLILTGTSGLATWNKIQTFITTHIINISLFNIIFLFLTLFSALGGLTVILGGTMLRTKNPKFGKLLILLGSGAGLIGLIISFLFSIKVGNVDLAPGISFATIGILLAITAQVIAKK